MGFRPSPATPGCVSLLPGDAGGVGCRGGNTGGERTHFLHFHTKNPQRIQNHRTSAAAGNRHHGSQRLRFVACCTRVTATCARQNDTNTTPVPCFTSLPTRCGGRAERQVEAGGGGAARGPLSASFACHVHNPVSLLIPCCGPTLPCRIPWDKGFSSCCWVCTCTNA
jgi:hypothetical protein